MKTKLLVDPKDNCIMCLTQFDPKRELHRVGKTKVRLYVYLYVPLGLMCDGFNILKLWNEINFFEVKSCQSLNCNLY